VDDLTYFLLKAYVNWRKRGEAQVIGESCVQRIGDLGHLTDLHINSKENVIGKCGTCWRSLWQPFIKTSERGQHGSGLF
jgi:hypothetical protein